MTGSAPASAHAGGGGRTGHGARTRSLRWRLSVTYAGVALLTALVLGGILLVMLQAHFSQREEAHLRAAADQVARDVLADRGGTPLEQVARLSAFGLQTRVQLYDGDGRLIVDSGPPGALQTSTMATPAASGVPAPQGSSAPAPQGSVAPAPQAATVTSGAGSQARSTKTFTRSALSGTPGGVTTIRVSEAPAEGASIMSGVLAAWAGAAAIAVLAAALVGLLISRRIAQPLTELATASDRMAAGDLAARAPAGGGIGEIDRLAGSFNTMAGRVESTVGALQRFVGDAAHELGTPLTALRADLEMAEDPASDDDERRRLVTRALEHERRLENLATGLLQLSRLESAGAAPVLEAVDLAALARAATDAYASRAEQADIALSCTAEEPAVRALADPARVATAVGNLIDNAVKFTPAGGSVAIEIREDAGLALLTVSDTGPGIPADDHERVFERFHRGSDAARYPGSGLGLAIVRAAVVACGGEVRLAASATGTSVEVRLPLAERRRG